MNEDAHINNKGQAMPKDSAADYIDKNIDLEELAVDIKALVTEHIQNSIPDDKKLMMDLVSQVGELTSEVKRLRQQLDGKPYSVYTCPSGQMQDITDELAEIKRLLAQNPKEIAEDLDSIIIHQPRQVRAEPLEPDEIDDFKFNRHSPERKIRREEEGETKKQEEPVEQKEESPPDKDTKKEKKPKKEKKKQTVASVLGNILFYVVIIGLVVGAFLAKSGGGGQPTVIAGYSAFTVLSSSMEDTYPKGSLIITHSVDADELEIGDDITYMASATSSITHRIIGITENYLNTGERAFETQGTMNQNADKDPVAAANVVGKVIFCSKGLGKASTFVSKNWPIMLFFVVVLCALFAFLKWNFKSDDEEEKKPEKKPKGEKRGRHEA